MRKKQTREGPAFFEPCGEISDDGTHERIRTSAAPSSLRALIEIEAGGSKSKYAKPAPADGGDGFWHPVEDSNLRPTA